MSTRVAVIGHIVFDEIILDDVPQNLKIPTGYGFRVGGKAFNAAVALARLGCEPALISAVGSDRIGDLAKQTLRKSGVDDAMIAAHTKSGVRTPTARLTQGKSRRRWVELDANPALDKLYESAVESAITDNWDAVLFTIELSDPSLPTVIEFLDVARKSNPRCKLVGYAAAVRTEPPGAEVFELLKNADCLTMNNAHASYLLGHPTAPESNIDVAREVGARCDASRVCVTFGRNGWVWVDGRDEGIERLPVAEIVDKIGASDVFAAALTAWLADGISFADATFAGAHAARLMVGRSGGSEHFPTRREVVASCDELTPQRAHH